MAELHDAVHGQVAFADKNLLPTDLRVAAILESAPMRRLKRIRQMPFANETYLGADHTRYAHSVGSGYLALRLARQLHGNGYFNPRRLDALRLAVPKISNNASDDDHFRTAIVEHLVIAGILQDVGELPYKSATDLFLRPHHSVATRVIEGYGFRVASSSTKLIFTLHEILDLFERDQSLQDHIDLGLIGFLLAGLVRDQTSPIPKVLLELRHLIDGQLDADRLDYVARDAYHTLGADFSITTTDVLESIVDLDERGLVFDSPGPVSSFLMKRATLRSQVYSSPAIRFRVTVLASVLSELLTSHPQVVDDHFGSPYGALSAEAFGQLDDDSLLSILEAIRRSPAGNTLPRSTTTAIGILLGESRGYDFVSLRSPNPIDPFENVTLDSDIFVDTFWDAESHFFYGLGSLRVRGAPYSLHDESVPLEDTGGDICAFLAANWDAPPSVGEALFFVPRHKRSVFDAYIRGTDETRYGLYRAARRRDAEVRLSVEDDTRAIPGCTGPAIFVSFSWSDIEEMRAILRVMRDRNQRYYAFVEPFHGLGEDTRANGARYASEAEGAIVLLSATYISRARDPESNIYPELVALGKKLPATAISYLCVEEPTDLDEIIDQFPWEVVGRSSPPFLGSVGLRNAPPHVVERGVVTAFERLGEPATAASQGQETATPD